MIKNALIYTTLGLLGYKGSYNDRLYAFLGAQGFTGSLNDRKRAYFNTLGFTGSITDQESKWQGPVGGAPAVRTVQTVSSPSVTEGQTIVFTITLSGTTEQTQNFEFTLGGSATGGTDYAIPLVLNNGVTISGNNFVVPTGVTSFTASTLTTDDLGVEASETVVLTVGGVTGTGTIIDNDAVAPENGFMAVGANSDWMDDWELPMKSVNLAHHMRQWTRETGTGNIVYNNWGEIQLSDTSTTAYTVLFTRFAAYPDATLSGNYEVWAQLQNGTGGNITVSGVNITGTTIASLDTTFKKVFEFSYSPVVGPYDHNQVIRFSGTTGRLIKLYVGKPEHLAQWNAGNIWHPDFIATVSSRDHWRSMNMMQASTTPEKSIAHRALPTHIRKLRCPIEDFLRLCDEANTKPYLNLPQMMDTQYATFVGQTLDTWLEGRNTTVYVAQGNEMTFNSSPPWRSGLYWAAAHALPKFEGVIDTDGSVITNNHGLVSGDKVIIWSHHDDMESIDWLASAFPFGLGVDPNIVVKNADAWFIPNAEQGGNWPKPANQTKVIWCKVPVGFDLWVENRIGKANMHVAMAEAINAELTPTNLAKVKYVIEGQSVNAGVLAGVLANIPSNKKSAVYHYASIAPYSNGPCYGSRVVASNGSIQLSLIGLNSLHYRQRVYYGLYPSATNPTNAQVIAGTGALDSGVYDIPNTSFSTVPYQVVDTMTGTNGTSYKVITVMTVFANPEYLVSKGLFENIPIQSRIETSFTLSATSQTLFGDMSYQDKLNFDDLAMKYAALDLEQHISVAEGRPLINYEDGAHYDGMQGYNTPPANKLHFHEWLKAYQNFSAQGVEWFDRLYHTYAVYAEGATYYKANSFGPFMVDGNYITGKTNRSILLDGYNKQVPRYSKLPTLGAVSYVSEIAPQSYPATIGTLLDSSGSNTLDSGLINYSIVGGSSEFSISGSSLQVTSGASGLYSPPTIRNLIIKASTPKLSNFQQISIQLGQYQFVNLFSLIDTGPPRFPAIETGFTSGQSGQEVNVAVNAGNYLWDIAFDITSLVATGDFDINEIITFKFRAKTSGTITTDYRYMLWLIDNNGQTIGDAFPSNNTLVMGTNGNYAGESTVAWTNNKGLNYNATTNQLILTVAMGSNLAHTYSIRDFYRA